MLKKLMTLIAFLAIASVAHARFSTFDNIESCEIARVNNLATPYVPATRAPFQGGKGWTRHVVPAGGACLGKAYVMEDGVPVKGKSVYVAEGFAYWQHESGAFRMHDCSNPFEELVLLARKEPVAVLPAPPAPAAQATPVPTTVVIEEKKVLRVVPYCELPDGTQVKATMQGGEAVCPDLKFRAPVSVDQPVRMQPHAIQVPYPAPQAPVYMPPITVPLPMQPQGCPGGNCVPQAQVLRQEPAPHGICGIRAVDSNRQTVGLIQIDNFQGRIRFARVAQWGGRPTHRPVLTDLPTSPRRNCDDDQGQVERHWAQVIKMLELPLDCQPSQRVAAPGGRPY